MRGRAAGLALLGLIPLAALAILLAPAEAQQAGKVYRIGMLGPGRGEQAEPYTAVFRQRMREHGWAEGTHFVLEIRLAEGRMELLPDLANDLVRSEVAVIVAWSTPAVMAAKRATTTIPIVIAAAGDPVATGLVASLSRPGGNVTGVSWLQTELSRKYTELLHNLLPRLSRIGVLFDPTEPNAPAALREVQRTAELLGLKVESAGARESTEIESAFAALKKNRAEALVVSPNAMNFVNRKRIIELAAANRLPAIYGINEFAMEGGLMSYGVDLPALTRPAADYVDKILRGAKPADLPIQQATKFELVINMKTAKALGLTIPPSLLLRADQVIE